MTHHRSTRRDCLRLFSRAAAAGHGRPEPPCPLESPFPPRIINSVPEKQNSYPFPSPMNIQD